MRHDLPALKLLGALSLAAGCTASLPFDDVSSDQDPFNEEIGVEPAEFNCKDLEDRAGVEFCSDFSSSDWEDDWNSSVEVYPAGNGVVERTTEGAVRSDPGALLATVGGTYEGDVYAASFIKENFSAYKDKDFHARISFQMRVEEFDAEEPARITAFQFLMGDAQKLSQLVLNLQSRGDGVAIQFTENNSEGGFQQGDFETIGVGEWIEVVLILKVKNHDGEGNSAKLYIDGEELFDAPLSYELFGLTPRMELGVPWVDTMLATEEWQLRYDNVLAEFVEI
jgi:hypothetical protein